MSSFDASLLPGTDPQYLPGAAGLVEVVDKKLLVILRDGRKVVGILRSYDQYANLVLQDAVERIIVDGRYGDIPRGVFVIRGENVVLLGEIDETKDETPGLKQVPIAEILAAQKKENEARRHRELLKQKALGVSYEVSEGMDNY
ncbi:u6 snRNA-associated Sm-like protein LSm1-like protein [Hyaloraphidium curvatum]|nr:u6 snRNA-associated Sm-like protein LSm1-like protein [Hyaloraphidium curvatum]